MAIIKSGASAAEATVDATANALRVSLYKAGAATAIEAAGAVAAQAYTLNRLLVDGVVRGDDGVTYSAVAARTAGAAHSEALMHLLSSACVYGYDASLGVGARDVPIGSDLASAISGRLATAFRGLNTDSLTCGIDNTVAAPNNVVSPIEARNFDAAADAAAALVGLTTNSRLAVYDGPGGDWNRWFGATPSTVSGIATNAVFSAYVNALTVGIDNTAAAVLRPVEARNFDSIGDVAASLVGLLTNSRISIFNVTGSGDWHYVQGTRAESVSSAPAENSCGSYVYQARASGFAAARRGKRFYTCNPVIGTPLTCQLAYVATTPSLVIRVNVETIRAIIRSLKLRIANTPGAIVNYAITLDTTDLYVAASGTPVTPSNTNEESATAAAALYYENPTTTGAGARIIDQGVIANVATTEKVIQFEDSLLMGITAATLSVYLWAATPAPQVYYNWDAEEVA